MAWYINGNELTPTEAATAKNGKACPWCGADDIISGDGRSFACCAPGCDAQWHVRDVYERREPWETDTMDEAA